MLRSQPEFLRQLHWGGPRVNIQCHGRVRRIDRIAVFRCVHAKGSQDDHGSSGEA